MSVRLSRTMIGILLWLAGQPLSAQELIPNGGFETYRTCPRQDNLLSEATPWYNPNRATPDFYNQCLPLQQIELPPHTGQGLGRLFLDNGWAEYMATPLKKPLEAGKCYAFEMYISTPTPPRYLPGTMGAYFSPDPLTGPDKTLFAVQPRILDAPQKSVNSRFKWERIGGTFKANGGERFVTIGSFVTLPKFLESYYIFLDDISLKPIELDLGRDTVLCGRKSQLLLNATTPGAIEYRWHDGSIAPTFAVTKPGTYFVTVTTPCIVLRDTITVDYALPFSLGADTTLCLGRSLTLRVPPGPADYRWQDGSRQPTFVVDRAGLYSLRVSQGNCTTTDSVRVAFVKAPSLNLGPDQALCGANVYPIDPTFSEGIFRWLDGFDQPRRTLGRSGVYPATVTNACATARDSVLIDYGDCGCVIYAPNIFTPNADGQNDDFAPIACGDITVLSLSVLNRWGEVIFQTSAAPFRWNGLFGGTACPAGVYAWHLDYVLRQGETDSRRQKDGQLLLRY
jgi:gliding motility-associated-like protein